MFSAGLRQLCPRKSLAALVCVNNMASSADAKPEIISKNLSFRNAFDSRVQEEERPMVLLYGWLVAKSKHIHSYGDFYLGKGFDVLHVKVDPAQVVWPLSAQEVCQDILDFSNCSTRQKKPVLVHGFSVGGYLYGETLVKILNNPQEYGPLSQRIVGQIFDSPVDLQGIPFGVSRAVTENKVLQNTIEQSLNLYLKLTEKYTTKYYLKSSAAFHENKLKIPSLMLYSEADIIGNPRQIEVVMNRWKVGGAKVDSQKWNDSRHVSHYHKHPVEYIAKLNNFLANIGLVHQDDEKAKIHAVDYN